MIPSEALLESLQWRYATKMFDPAREIPGDVWETLEQSLVLTPSSYGLQPWRFVVVTDPDLKARLAAQSWRQSQPADCSHFVVFAAREKVDERDIDRFLERVVEVRGGSLDALAGFRRVMVGDVVSGGRSRESFEWATRQAYIALGQFMAAAALLGVDACPMEGIVPAEFDRLLGLEGSGYRTVVACAAGYRAAGDKYAVLPKVRFPRTEVVIRKQATDR